MKSHHRKPGDAPPIPKRVEAVSRSTDPPLEQRADMERALHGIFTERFGTRIADRVMPSFDNTVPSANPTPALNPAPQRKNRRRRPKPKRSPARSLEQTRIAAHEARCTICSHPERAEIEEEFLHWENSWNIAHDHQVNRRAIYRHAHAFNLFAGRNRNLRYALGLLIEEADRVPVTADAVIRAVHAFTRVNDKGQWIEPPSRVIVSRGPSPAAPPSAPAFDVPNPRALPAATAQNLAAGLHAPLDTTGRSEFTAND